MRCYVARLLNMILYSHNLNKTSRVYIVFVCMFSYQIRDVYAVQFEFYIQIINIIDVINTFKSRNWQYNLIINMSRELDKIIFIVHADLNWTRVCKKKKMRTFFFFFHYIMWNSLIRTVQFLQFFFNDSPLPLPQIFLHSNN